MVGGEITSNPLFLFNLILINMNNWKIEIEPRSAVERMQFIQDKNCIRSDGKCYHRCQGLYGKFNRFAECPFINNCLNIWILKLSQINYTLKIQP